MGRVYAIKYNPDVCLSLSPLLFVVEIIPINFQADNLYKYVNHYSKFHSFQFKFENYKRSSLNICVNSIPSKTRAAWKGIH